MKKIMCAIFLLFISVSVMADLEQVEIDHLKKAIDVNDIEKFQAILKKSVRPFKSGLLDSSGNSEMTGMDLIKYATKSKTCRDGFIQILIDSGAKPDSTYLLGASNAATQLCPRTVELIAPFFKDEIQAEFGIKAIENTKWKIKSFSENNVGTEEELNNAGKVVKFFNNKATEKCKEYDVKNKWCLVKDEFKNLQDTAQSEAKKMEAEEKESDRANSPDGIKELICELQDEINEAQSAINRQKEIAKTSGVVDKSVLLSKGARIVDLKKEISELKMKHKKVSKKKFDLICN